MDILDAAAAPSHLAPIPGGPTVRPLAGADGAGPVAVLHITLPAGGNLPEHDHGASHIVLLPLAGQVRLSHAGQSHDLAPGGGASIAVGERVSLANPWSEPVTLAVVATPPDFAAVVTGWPAG